MNKINIKQELRNLVEQGLEPKFKAYAYSLEISDNLEEIFSFQSKNSRKIEPLAVEISLKNGIYNLSKDSDIKDSDIQVIKLKKNGSPSKSKIIFKKESPYGKSIYLKLFKNKKDMLLSYRNDLLKIEKKEKEVKKFFEERNKNLKNELDSIIELIDI